eukprot:1905625-Pleurochrysis_carterae.AAC.1
MSRSAERGQEKSASVLGNVDARRSGAGEQRLRASGNEQQHNITCFSMSRSAEKVERDEAPTPAPLRRKRPASGRPQATNNSTILRVSACHDMLKRREAVTEEARYSVFQYGCEQTSGKEAWGRQAKRRALRRRSGEGISGISASRWLLSERADRTSFS